MAKNDNKLSFFDRGMNLANRFFEGMHKFKKKSASAEKENGELDENLNPQEESALPEDCVVSTVEQEESSNTTPASTLPQGWAWIDYDDGSGHLKSPGEKYYFSYDRAPYHSSGGIEYKACSGSSWDIFYGSLSDFKEHAEQAVSENFLQKIEIVSKAPDQASIKDIPSKAQVHAAPKDDLILGEFDIGAIMSKVANNAWYGREPTIVSIMAGKNHIEISGYIYEPSYEDFSATSSVSLNGTVLFGVDSRNVGAYRNETYQIGVYKKPEDAVSHIRDITNGQEYVAVDLENSKPSLSEQIYCASSHCSGTADSPDIMLKNKCLER